MRFDIISIFPEIFDGWLSQSLLARGQKKKILKLTAHNLRDWTDDKHKTVDDRPFGGGPGMLMKVEPIMKAVESLKSKVKSKKSEKARVILFSPRGKKFTQTEAKRLAKYDQLILICGRYEGVDERVADYLADETLSIGDYVLNGSEVAAMGIIETGVRMLPGFIAKTESAVKADHAQYTRPEEILIAGKKRAVPKVLLGGDHKKIALWREKHS